MNTEALFIFLILLLGLILCSFLGGRNNFGFTEGFNSTNTGTFYGPDGATATFAKEDDGKQSIKLNQTDEQGILNIVTFTQSKTDNNIYTNPFGFTAMVTTNPDGEKVIIFFSENGETTVFAKDKNQTSNDDDNLGFINALKNKINKPYNHYTDSKNQKMSSTQYYGSTGYPYNQSSYSLSYQGPYGGSADSVAGTSINSYDYSSSLPQGIPKSQIPSGQEDLYILKSEIVPPVCPACPAALSLPREEPPPPCPACARCPEPSFECKKVPNYNAINNDYLPSPVLNDFSQFGM